MELYKNFFRHWGNVHNITTKVMKLFPEDKKDFKPAEPMMTAMELMKHIATVEKTFLESCKKGSIEYDDFGKYGKIDFDDLKSLIDYFEKTHKEVDAYYSQVGDKGMEKIIKTPWGDSPAFHQLSGAYDHEWHHRGQLYVYSRLLGIEPPFVFDYPQ